MNAPERIEMDSGDNDILFRLGNADPQTIRKICTLQDCPQKLQKEFMDSLAIQ